MAGFQSFEEIDAWKKARKLTNEVCALTRQGTFSKDYGLRDLPKMCQTRPAPILTKVKSGLDPLFLLLKKKTPRSKGFSALI